MDFTASNVESAELELLEPLIITEDGDVSEGVPEGEATTGSTDVASKSCSEDSALEKKEEPSGEDGNEEAVASKMDSGEQRSRQNIAEEVHKPQSRKDAEQNTDSASEEKSHEVTNEKPSEAAEEEVPQEDHRVEIKRLETSGHQTKGAEKHEEDAKKAHRLTPDFPEALFELLCTLQEGRRLNDQRCSFSLEEGMGRRRCHSEPNTRKPVNRVVFCSMTSLQKEEFFDLVATAQARRLDDQRAHLGRAAPPKPKSRSLRGSLRQLSIVKKPEPVPAPVPKDDLYDMIRTTQAQGRLEDQRSWAPGPTDDEAFFSLLLRVQGGRMDEQRTELPCLLQT